MDGMDGCVLDLSVTPFRTGHPLRMSLRSLAFPSLCEG